MASITEVINTPFDGSVIEMELEDLTDETPSDETDPVIIRQDVNMLGKPQIEDAPDDFVLDGLLESMERRAQGQNEKKYGLPSISILKDEMWYVITVSGAVFDNLPSSWEERKTLHIQVNQSLVEVSFSDTVNFVTMRVFQASRDTPFNDLVGFSRRDLNVNTSFSNDNYLSIIKKPNGFHVSLFDELVPMDTVRFNYKNCREEIFDDCTYTPFSTVYINPLKELLETLVPLTSIKTSVKGRTIGNRLYFIENIIYLVHEDSSMLIYPCEGSIKFPNCCLKSKFLKALLKLLEGQANGSVEINISDNRLQVVGDSFTISTSLFPINDEIKQKSNGILDSINSDNYIPIKLPVLLDISRYTNAIQYTDNLVAINYDANGSVTCTPKRKVGMKFLTNFLISRESNASCVSLDKPYDVSTFAIQRLLPAYKNAYDVKLLLHPPGFVILKYVNCNIILCDSKSWILPLGTLA